MRFILLTFLLMSGVACSEQRFDCRKPRVSARDSLETIRKAYRNFLLHCHPDKRGGLDPKEVHAAFVAGQAAFDILIKAKAGEESSEQAASFEQKEDRRSTQQEKRGSEKSAKPFDFAAELLKVLQRGNMHEILAFYTMHKPPKTLNDSLADAVKDGDVHEAKRLLEEGASAAFEKYGKPVLVTAVQNNHPALVKLLLDCGAAANTHYLGKSVLYTAVQYASYGIVSLLLEAGADAHTECFGKSVLYLAVQNDNVTIARLLLKHGANPNRQFLRKSPLILAAQANNAELVKLLLTYKADPCYTYLGRTADYYAYDSQLKQLLSCKK
jgi:hypothetical protein